MPEQLDFLDSPSQPEGFSYRAELLTADEEADLLAFVRLLPFKPFEFRGYFGKRRIVSFGWAYDFAKGSLQPAEPLPGWLLPLRDAASRFACMRSESLEQVLVTEYPAGASIGWHRDRPAFGDVVGVSLNAGCLLRFRRGAAGTWERFSRSLAPRSAYLLSGSARRDWEHSIPAVAAPRYSVTLRTLRAAPPATLNRIAGDGALRTNR